MDIEDEYNTKIDKKTQIMLKSELVSLIYVVEDYCRCYDCGQELKSACKDAKETLVQANKSFNKGKRKK